MQPGSGDPSPGQVLSDRYVVERIVGRGGMGVVVAAQDRAAKRRVALKMMHEHDLKNAVAVERFFREARAALRLRSEYVLRLFEVSRLPTGRPFMVMEYLEGKDLSDVLREEGPLPVADAARFAMQAALACEEAHAAGIVHRDLKPSNLFIVGAGAARRVKLLDFGISKLAGLSGTVGHALTATGDLTGSPLYMPPEQLRARTDIDGRVDIWAIGATLFELVTGARPFQAENMMAECHRILNDTPKAPSTLRRAVPAGLDAVVLRCLEKEPSNRFQTAGELARALAPFAKASSGRRKVALLLAVLVAGALGAAAWLSRAHWQTATAPPPEAPKAAEP